MRCSLCGDLIAVDQVEMELEFKRHGIPAGLDRYYLHIHCLAAWEFERTKLTA